MIGLVQLANQKLEGAIMGASSYPTPQIPPSFLKCNILCVHRYTVLHNIRAVVLNLNNVKVFLTFNRNARLLFQPTRIY